MYGNPDTGIRRPDSGRRSRCQTAEKVRANTMTMKQKLEIHRQIKRQNQENVKKWKEVKVA